MSSARASLIVPFFNVEHYIDDCLSSIEQQTLANIDVVLVDDGSTDGSRSIAEAYCERDERFRLRVQPNRGLASSRNAGVADATGDYLMFVDSDDLLPPRAVELLVSRLDATGSAIAVGNARRFDGFVTEPSWGQLRSAATDRNVTSLEAFPALAADRIACNKMFRRGFWSQGEYVFPEIRYEDYPVVLRALFDAPSIDCVSAPVYFWRRRADGGSITQQSFDVDNALDRLASAQLVLDLVDTRGIDSVKREVDNLLARIDVPAVFAAFAGADGDSRECLADRLDALIRRLDTHAVRPSSGLLALQLHALRLGDYESLRAYARHRISVVESDDPTRVNRRRPWRRQFRYPTNSDRHAMAPARLSLVPYWRQRLSTSVDQLAVEGSELIIHGSAQIDFVTKRPAISVQALARGHTLHARVHADRTGPGFVARFDCAAFGAIDDAPWEIVVTARDRWLRRCGPLAHADAATRPSGAVAGALAGSSVRARFDDGGRVVVDVEGDPAMMTVIGVHGSVFDVRSDAGAGGSYSLRREDGSTVALGVHPPNGARGGELQIDVTPILDDPPADNPATGVAAYTVIEAGGGRAVLADPTSCAVRSMSGRWMIAATQSAAGEFVLERSAPEPVVDGVDVVAGEIVLAGGGTVPWSVEWRAVQQDRVVVAEIESSGDSWRATASAAEILVAEAVAPRTLLWIDGRPARTDGFALHSLPMIADTPSGRVRIAVYGRTVQASPL